MKPAHKRAEGLSVDAPRFSAACHMARKTSRIKGKEGVGFQADLSPNKFIPVEHFSESHFPVEKCSAGTLSG